MEIKVGITNVGRELTVETDESADEVTRRLTQALVDGSVLALADKNGRTIVVPVSGIAYLDLGQEHARKVGFGLG